MAVVWGSGCGVWAQRSVSVAMSVKRRSIPGFVNGRRRSGRGAGFAGQKNSRPADCSTSLPVDVWYGMRSCLMLGRFTGLDIDGASQLYDRFFGEAAGAKFSLQS